MYNCTDIKTQCNDIYLSMIFICHAEGLSAGSMSNEYYF